VKLGKSATETLEMLREAFGEQSLGPRAVFEWYSRFNAGRVFVDRERPGRPNTNRTKTVAKQSMSLQTPLGSVMDFASRS
jgi:hypothetical protein